MEIIISKLFAKIDLFWGIFAASAAIFSVWLYAFYPANLSIDSINQLSQISTGNISNAHPYVFTLFLGAFVKYLGGVTAFVLFQILVSSLIAALFASYFYKKGVNRYVIAATLVAFWFSPVVGIYNVTIWKDVIFSQLIVLLGYVYLRFFDDDAPTNLAYVFLGLSLLISLTRHNGAIYLLLSPLLLYFSRPRCHPILPTVIPAKAGIQQFTLKAILIATTSLILIYLAITGPIASMVIPSNNSVFNVSSALRLQLAASVISSNDANLTSDELTYYEGIINKGAYASTYRCSSIDSLIVGNKSSIDGYFTGNVQRQSEFAIKSNKLFLKNIPLVIADRSCLFAYQLGLGMRGWYDPYYTGISVNDMGYAPHQTILTKPFTGYLYWTIYLPQRAVFWNHALVIILYIAALIYGVVKKNARIMGFAAIICINVPLLFLIGVSNDYRYLYVLTMGIFFLPGVVLVDRSIDLLKKRRQ